MGAAIMTAANAMQSNERALSPEQQPNADALVKRLADTLHRLNEQIEAAVKAGATVELIRASRYHNGIGQWGDQMMPIVRLPDIPDRD
ncbi:hypothetical protein [Hyphomicrobium sulfonivorans]|uniref:hypothetical protein n=2 Tax=Hyphomicrobium sulfonivorans TaxID=121290 RepID=UPI001FED3E51|nr:hypothetical protein [Hyphomicrobium sulfonivorans]